MSTSQHTIPANTNTYDKNATHQTGVYDKNHPHNNEHVKDEFAGNRGTTSSADNLRNDPLVKTGGYTTGLEAASGVGAPAGHAVPVTSYNQNVIGGTPITNVPSAGPQLQNTVPNAANRDGLVVNDGIGGARGGAAVLGAQCECTMNGGHCSHGAGNCVCRGCTTKATTINPGINIGVSTTQYTAPAGTTGIGGGVMEYGTGIAGLVHTNTAATARPGDANQQGCECVRKNGACGCAAGTCACSHCTGLRESKWAAAKAEQEKQHEKNHHHNDKDGKDKHHHAHSSTHTTASTNANAGHMSTETHNIDGNGRNTTHFGQGTTVGAPVTNANPAASTATGSVNTYGGQSHSHQ